MRTVKIFILLIFISCQSQNCDCEGFIDWKSDKVIKVYSDANEQNEIAELQNDLENEDFLTFKILDTKNDFFKVEIGREMSENRILGWIKKDKEIAIYDRNYSSSGTLNLYSKPSLNSIVKTKVTGYQTNYYTIKDCKGKWIYAYRKKDGKIYEGWLEPTMQCPSPYTTCN